MKKPFKLKYFILSLFILTNSLIVFESSLPGSISNQRSSLFTDVVSLIINGVLPDRQPDYIDITSLEVKDHKSQIVSSSQSIEIPLGVTRRFTTSILPLDATDKTVIWTSSHPEALRVTSGGYLEARQLAEAVEVQVKTSNQSFDQIFYVNVVPKSAPVDFSVELAQSQIEVGQSTRLVINLTEQEKREYNPSLLDYYSSQESVATINQFGVINALAPGTTQLTVSGHSQSYELIVTASSEAIIKPTSITLTGPDSAYVYGYTPLTYTFDREDVSDQTVTFVSSNEAIATIDEQGVVYGTKVSGLVTIRVYANADFEVYDDLTLNMLDVLPTNLSLSISNNELNAGTKATILPTLTHDLADQSLPVTNQEVVYRSSDETIATVVSINGQGIVLGIKRGSVTITANSVANPEVGAQIVLTIIPLEVINDDNVVAFGAYLRKAVGHFTLFFINGILGGLTFYYFLARKTLLIRLTLALIPGVFFAGLSEFIQLFVPDRGATLFDVMIDSLGYLFAVLIIYLWFILRKRLRIKKDIKPQPDVDEINV